MPSIAEKIKHLHRYFPLRENQVEGFLNDVAQLVDTKDPKVIRPILMLADDHCALSGAVIQMLSTLEEFPLDVYVAELLAALPEFYAQSPFWCEQEVQKVLHSDPESKVLIRACKNLDLKTMDVLCAILSQIASDSSAHVLKSLQGMGVR